MNVQARLHLACLIGVLTAPVPCEIRMCDSAGIGNLKHWD